jgi:putative endonuclease
MATTYILYSPSLDKYYVGYTSDNMETRLKKHLSDHDGFTAKAKDWALVFTKVFDHAKDAHPATQSHYYPQNPKNQKFLL